MALADMDGDGDLDVAIATHVNGFVNGDGFYTIVLNQTPAGGPLAFSTAANIPSTQASAAGIVAADLDNDGDIDLALAHFFDVSVTVFLNDGTGVAGSVTKESLSGQNTSGPRDLAVGDVNGDGYLDLVALRPFGFSLLLNLDGGSNPVNAGTLRSQPQETFSAHGVAGIGLVNHIGLADFDGDGSQDLVVTMVMNFPVLGAILIFPGTGPAAFGNGLPFLSGVQHVDLALCDLDGDSDIDILTADTVGQTVYVLDNHALTPWQDLGQALAGTHGNPCATATGSALGGSVLTLRLKNALENSPAFILASPATINMPLVGGVVVPDYTLPGALLIPVSTDAAGCHRLDVNWPAGIPAGLHLYLQYWLADPGGISGFAASNALALTTP